MLKKMLISVLMISLSWACQTKEEDDDSTGSPKSSKPKSKSRTGHRYKERDDEPQHSRYHDHRAGRSTAPKLDKEEAREREMKRKRKAREKADIVKSTSGKVILVDEINSELRTGAQFDDRTLQDKIEEHGRNSKIKHNTANGSRRIPQKSLSGTNFLSNRLVVAFTLEQCKVAEMTSDRESTSKLPRAKTFSYRYQILRDKHVRLSTIKEETGLRSASSDSTILKAPCVMIVYYGRE